MYVSWVYYSLGWTDNFLAYYIYIYIYIYVCVCVCVRIAISSYHSSLLAFLQLASNFHKELMNINLCSSVRTSVFMCRIPQNTTRTIWHIYIYIYIYIVTRWDIQSFKNVWSPVQWDCRIRQLHLCKRGKTGYDTKPSGGEASVQEF